MARANETGMAGREQPPPELHVSRTFPAPRPLVFKAWSSAGHIRRWFSPETFSVPDAEVDLRVGGRFDVCMRSPGGQESWIRGIFVEVTPHDRLVIDMSVHDAGGRMLFTARTEVTFADDDLGTRMDVAQTYSFADPAVAAPMVAGAAEGWRTTLDKLQIEIARMQSDG